MDDETYEDEVLYSQATNGNAKASFVQYRKRLHYCCEGSYDIETLRPVLWCDFGGDNRSFTLDMKSV